MCLTRLHQQTWYTPFLPLLLVTSSVVVVYIWPTNIGCVFGGLFICYAGLTLWNQQSNGLPRFSRALIAFSRILFLTVLFGNVYFAFLSFSSYPDQFFRVSSDSRVGHALDRIIARQYLAKIHADYLMFLDKTQTDISAFRKDEEFTWLISSGVMEKFAGPVAELSEDLEQDKLNNFAHSLALYQGRLYRYYPSGISGKLPYTTDDPIGSSAISFISTNDGKDLDFIKVNAAILLTTEKLQEQFTLSGELPDRRDIYLSSLFFSSMLFMTSGYGDILPNSPIIFLLMGINFIVYLVVFCFMIPLALENKTS